MGNRKVREPGSRTFLISKEDDESMSFQRGQAGEGGIYVFIIFWY